MRPQKDGWSDWRGLHIRRDILLRKERVEGPSNAYCDALLYKREHETLWELGPSSKQLWWHILSLVSMLLITKSKQRGPSWEAKNWYPNSQNISHVLWKPNVHYRIHKSLSPVPILNQMNLINGVSLYFCKIF
jgi:hypothetical protein